MKILLHIFTFSFILTICSPKAWAGFRNVDAATPLPIVMGGFIAAPAGHESVKLAWITRQESNSADFVIERRTDHTDWISIGVVDAQGYAGVQTNYYFTDIHPADGVAYYRLRVEDKDGNFGYTQIEIARMTLQNATSVFPNPARDFIQVDTRAVSSNGYIRIIAVSGQMLQEKRVNVGEGKTSLCITNLPSGIYFVETIVGGRVDKTEKLMVVR